MGHPDDFRDVVVVLMAGGAGTRLWPLSTPSRPKHFLTELTGRSLYVQAADRAGTLVPPQRVVVMTNEAFVGHVREQTPDIPAENVVCEPLCRDTAAAVILAALIIERRWPGSVVVTTPSDHLIDDLGAFRATLAVAVARAREGGLGTVGIRPTCPSTDFGYLRLAEEPSGGGAVRVEKFVEKPPRDAAEGYLATGRYLWNAGMFIWRADALLAAARQFLPQAYEPLAALMEWFGTEAFAGRARRAFEALTPISVDYGIMEKAENVWSVPARFGWNDVGSWLAVAETMAPDANGNRVRGPVVLDEASDNVIVTEDDHLVVVSGVKGCLIVCGPAGVLVCAADAADRIKALVQKVHGR